MLLLLIKIYFQVKHIHSNWMEYDKDLNYAIENSLTSNDINGPISLEAALHDESSKINDEKISIFNFYRSDIFNCCIRGLKRKSFSPYNKISVKFSDVDGIPEGAIDAGGPMREMFTVVLKHIQNSQMFVGPELKKKYKS